jgi:hypothetical protein
MIVTSLDNYHRIARPLYLISSKIGRNLYNLANKNPTVISHSTNRATDEHRTISHFHFLSLSFPLSYISYRQLQVEKIRGKIILFGMIFAVANLAESLAQDLLRLPFWQAGRPICHFGSSSSLVGL